VPAAVTRPDIIKVAALQRVAKQHEPTRPYTANTLDETSRHVDGMPSPGQFHPETSRFAESRIRRNHRSRGHSARSGRTVDDVVGQPGDGRVGEVIIRPGKLRINEAAAWRAPGDNERNDNVRANAMSPNTPSTRRSHRDSPGLGSVEEGKLADLVFWSPAFFGVKPDLVIKGGMIVCAAMGDPMPRSQRRSRSLSAMFGSYGGALAETCLTFVSGAALDAGLGKALR